MAALAKKFASRERKTAPIEVGAVPADKVHGLKPELVAEIAFAEYTAGGSVRHSSFLGLRSDKEAKDVTPEKKQPTPAPESDVKISSRDRVIFPEVKATKSEDRKSTRLNSIPYC